MLACDDVQGSMHQIVDLVSYSKAGTSACCAPSGDVRPGALGTPVMPANLTLRNPLTPNFWMFPACGAALTV